MKNVISIVGFLFFAFGLLSIVLSLVGVQLVFLNWIDALGTTWGFLLKLIMIIAGIVMLVLARTDWQKENQQPTN